MRIASLSPATTEILFALGVGASIVCRDQFSNWPESARDIPKLMGHDRVDPEELRKHAPDIVFTETVVQEKIAGLLREKGFSVVHQDPRTVNQIYESIRALGTIVGRDKEAAAVTLKMQQGFNTVQKKARLLPKTPRVYVEEWHEPPFASGNWVPEVVRVAGGRQFPVSDGELSRKVTLAEIMAFDPDLIVTSWCGSGSLGDKELLLQRAGWDLLRAVREGKVHIIDDAFLNRPGPRLTEGAGHLYGWLFELLH